MEAFIRQKLKDEGYFAIKQENEYRNHSIVNISKESTRNLPELFSIQRNMFETFIKNYEKHIGTTLRDDDQIHLRIEVPLTEKYIELRRNNLEFHKKRIKELIENLDHSILIFYTGKRSDLYTTIKRHAAESFDCAMIVLEITSHIRSEHAIITELNNRFVYDS